jgi:hypothetical protein
MVDDQWPVATSREEMLARVAARGRRIRATRGALNAVAVLAAIGVSSIGVGAVVQRVSDGTSGTEVDGVATGPQRPEFPTDAVGDPDVGPRPTGVPDDGVGESTGSESAGSGRTTTTRPGSSTSGTTAQSTAQSTTPQTGSSSSSTTSTTPGTTVTTTVVVTTTTVPTDPTGPSDGATPRPAVGNPKARTSGLPTNQSICAGENDSVVVVEIMGADFATLSWTQGSETTMVPMERDGTSWWAPIGAVDGQFSGAPIIVSIEAQGMGGTAHETAVFDVVECTPQPRA